MTNHFYEAYHLAVKLIGQFLSVGAGYKFLTWLKKSRRENEENGVLDTFGNRNWHWLSGDGVLARKKRDAAYKYARALFPPRVTDLSSLTSRLCLVPHSISYWYHRTFLIPSRERADRILRNLFKRQLLICAPDNPSLYRLKPGV
jgi:hypothetical protein